MSTELGSAKLRGILRRRKLAIVGTALVTIAVCAAIIGMLEPGYKAGAIVRVQEVQPAKEYVAPTVTEQVGERLKSLRLAVMGRPLLVEVARKLKMKEAYPRRNEDEIVDSMRAGMDVKVEGEDTFLVTYVDSDPHRAQAVVNRLAELFMKQHIEQRHRIASATEQALKTEVDALKPQLDQADKAVREFKLAHYGALPEQMEGNLRVLDQTAMEINIQSTNLDMDHERRRALLSASFSPLRHHEDTLAGQLYEARTRYTPDNPEVKRIQAEHARVHEQRVTEERDLSSKLRKQNPELMALEGEIARTRSLIAGLRDRQKQMRDRVDGTAKNAQQLAALTTTYDALKEKYNSTLGRLREAELASNVEKNLGQMRFDLIEAASVPQHATAPNRPLLGVGALVLALLLGLGAGFALDARDHSIRDPEQLVALPNYPPLFACIPHVEGSGTTGPKLEA